MVHHGGLLISSDVVFLGTGIILFVFSEILVAFDIVSVEFMESFGFFNNNLSDGVGVWFGPESEGYIF
jgi:hypothetical protein